MAVKGQSILDIAVVGGGPVGAAAAIALARQGFRVALVERGGAPAPYDPAGYDERVYAMAPASARFLDGLGVWPDIAGARASAYSAMRIWERDPSRGLRFAAADSGRAELGWIVEHSLLVSTLWARLGGVERHERVTIAAASFGEEHAALDWAGGGLKARLLVAADGADSQLRELAGIATVAWGYPQRALVCQVRTGQPHRGTAWQRFLGSGPLAFLPLADGRCSIVWSVEEALAREMLGLDDAAFRQRLEEASEGALGVVLEATPRLSFPLRLLHAHEYARPGLVLVGDAAHAIHPLAGQGVNLGLADAAQLADTLARARDAGRHWWALRHLQAYGRARKAANLEMMALTDGLHRAFRARAPGLRAVLGLGMEAVDRLEPLKAWLARQAV